MHIVFLHYHLMPGGVTRVIQQQAAVCEQAGWKYCILAGDNPTKLPNVVTIPELHYDVHRSHVNGNDTAATDSTATTPSPALLLTEKILHSIETFFHTKSHEKTIIHTHNATLAKNSDLLPALNILRERRIPLFLQIHDFPEDWRPAMYPPADYPADVHYGCINSRDQSALSRAGIPDDRIHIIPNLVSPLPGATAPQGAVAQDGSGSGSGSKVSGKGSKRFALYPVRGIRRKNIGELILLSVLFNDITFGITLEPKNPADIPSYRFWENFAKETKAPVEFNIAEREGFAAALERADFFISTSVQEGFGFTFLEPWTLQKAVAGRTIPYVNTDFTASGIHMNYMYDEIPVPVEEVDMDLFQETWIVESQKRFTCFAIALRNQGLDRAAENIRRNFDNLAQQFSMLYGSRPHIDFARLDKMNQAEIIRRLASDTERAQTIKTSVPQLLSCPFHSCGSADRAVIEHNYQTVYENYGESQYRRRLQAIYHSIIHKPFGTHSPPLNREVLLQSFLDPANIFLITSS
ncbi:MAG: hypothetical protein ACR2PY_04360 [Salinispira sp.]